MTDYSQNTNFTAKDSLASGTPAKKILGAELDAELSEISTAIATKMNTIGSLSVVTPTFNTDYAPIYDDSSVSDKRVLLSSIAPTPSSLVLARGDSGGSAIIVGTSTYREIDNFAAATYDKGGCYNGTGQIAPASADDDGIWLVFGRVTFSGIGSGLIRFGVTRYNGGTPQSRQYCEFEANSVAENIFQVFGIHNLTYASGDYVALEFLGTSAAPAVPANNSNILIGFRVF